VREAGARVVAVGRVNGATPFSTDTLRIRPRPAMKKRFELTEFNGMASAGPGPQSPLFAKEREEAWHACHEGDGDAMSNPRKPRHRELEQLLDWHLGIGEHSPTRRLAEAAWRPGEHPQSMNGCT
jgi:hypothetical protein